MVAHRRVGDRRRRRHASPTRGRFTYTGDPGRRVQRRPARHPRARRSAWSATTTRSSPRRSPSDDGVNAPVSSAPTTLTVGNVAPVVDARSCRRRRAPPGTTVAVSSTVHRRRHERHAHRDDRLGRRHHDRRQRHRVGAARVPSAARTSTRSTASTPSRSPSPTTTAVSRTSTTSVTSDTTPPVITPTVSPTPNGAGWNNSVATITWTVTDSLSPIDVDDRV